MTPTSIELEKQNKTVYFTGVVEDRLDPLKLGRVRVRIHGFHSENKILIPTEHLPWAVCIHPLSASVSSIGSSSVSYVEGSWVLGIFLDGETRQKPIILGSIFGIPEESSNSQIGFYDPKTPDELKKYPRLPEEEPTAIPFPKNSQLNESDFSRLARNEFVEEKTIVGKKQKTRTKNVPTALGMGGVWDQPNSRYDTVYPFNSVTESESGHVFEVDDTPGAERIQTYHRSGSFEEYLPDGSKVTKVVKNNFEIVVGDSFVNISGVGNITTNGNFNLLSEGSIHLETKNNLSLYVHGDADVRVDGSAVVNVKGGDLDLNVENGDLVIEAQNISATVHQNLVANVSGSTEILTGGNLDLRTEGNVFHKVLGNYDLHVDGKVDIRGNPIHLNIDKS